MWFPFNHFDLLLQLNCLPETEASGWFWNLQKLLNLWYPTFLIFSVGFLPSNQFLTLQSWLALNFPVKDKATGLEVAILIFGNLAYRRHLFVFESGSLQQTKDYDCARFFCSLSEALKFLLN